jgi:hypothetical protein
MFKFIPRRAARVALGLGIAAALWPAGIAQAATDDSTVIVTGAPAVALTTAPTFGNFPDAVLTGSNQDVTASVTNWKVTDATGAAPGWSVNVTADVPHNGGSTVNMTGAALALTMPVATTEGTNASTAPVVAGSAPQLIGGGGVNIANAIATTGAGVWNLAQGADQLTLTIPADAKVASYTTTLTTTLNAAF